MRHIVFIVLGVLAISTSVFAQTAADTIERALAGAPADDREEATVIAFGSCGRATRVRIHPETAGDIQRVTCQNSVAKRRRDRAPWEIDRASCGRALSGPHTLHGGGSQHSQRHANHETNVEPLADARHQRPFSVCPGHLSHITPPSGTP